LPIGYNAKYVKKRRISGGSREWDRGDGGGSEEAGSHRYDGDGGGSREWDRGGDGSREWDRGGDGSREWDRGGGGSREWDRGDDGGSRGWDRGGDGSREWNRRGGSREWDRSDGGGSEEARELAATATMATAAEGGTPAATTAREIIKNTINKTKIKP
jgi:hypothetical protein